MAVLLRAPSPAPGSLCPEPPPQQQPGPAPSLPGPLAWAHEGSPGTGTGCENGPAFSSASPLRPAMRTPGRALAGTRLTRESCSAVTRHLTPRTPAGVPGGPPPLPVGPPVAAHLRATEDGPQGRGQHWDSQARPCSLECGTHSRCALGSGVRGAGGHGTHSVSDRSFWLPPRRLSTIKMGTTGRPGPAGQHGTAPASAAEPRLVVLGLEGSFGAPTAAASLPRGVGAAVLKTLEVQD